MSCGPVGRNRARLGHRGVRPPTVPLLEHSYGRRPSPCSVGRGWAETASPGAAVSAERMRGDRRATRPIPHPRADPDHPSGGGRTRRGIGTSPSTSRAPSMSSRRATTMPDARTTRTSRSMRSTDSSRAVLGHEADYDRVLATVLFTDIVGSTETSVRARATAAGANCSTGTTQPFERLLGRYRGREVDTAGDGFFATFDGPARAIRCANAILDAIQPLGLEVRAGTAHRRGRDDRRQHRRHRGQHRRPRRRARRPVRGPRLPDREGPRRRLGPRVRGRRRARAQGRPGSLASIPGGGEGRRGSSVSGAKRGR